ncbi:uncharacterized protein J3D65DRAFT_261722 [Phyllosticta citribraziliensis]|uniref:Uncharacterized protein n=1 Tax=Phyllosticta citribraziliensis TaxID=989973 RepID=A0ABR1M4B9_9PEZI
MREGTWGADVGRLQLPWLTSPPLLQLLGRLLGKEGMHFRSQVRFAAMASLKIRTLKKTTRKRRRPWTSTRRSVKKPWTITMTTKPNLRIWIRTKTMTELLWAAKADRCPETWRLEVEFGRSVTFSCPLGLVPVSYSPVCYHYRWNERTSSRFIQCLFHILHRVLAERRTTQSNSVFETAAKDSHYTVRMAKSSRKSASVSLRG